MASFSQVRELAGILQAHMALRSVDEGNDFAVISTWTTPDAAMAVFGRNVDRVASIPGVSEHLDFRSVEHFEIDESLLIHADEPPTVARIAVGSVQLGNDVEIQQEIRTRMGALGGQVAEAYVGRRIRDRTVEIAFVTCGPAGPDRPLDEPLWHDVAERYDSYWIEVYDEIYRLRPTASLASAHTRRPMSGTAVRTSIHAEAHKTSVSRATTQAQCAPIHDPDAGSTSVAHVAQADPFVHVTHGDGCGGLRGPASARSSCRGTAGRRMAAWH